MPTFEGSGIPEDAIENFDEYRQCLQSLTCVMCLDIVRKPVECPKCESLYCQECWNLLKSANKGCVMRCKDEVVPANRFVFAILSKLKIKCFSCGKGGISYEKYILHSESCMTSRKFGSVNKIREMIEKKETEINDLKKSINAIKRGDTASSVYRNMFYSNQDAPKMSVDQIRRRFITCGLGVNQKMELYNAAVEGKLSVFCGLLNKGYPMFEEVSAKNYYWTPLHYAMHYGKWEIARFILDEMQKKGDLQNIMRLTTVDNRCPVLCFLKSNALSYDVKKSILENTLERYNFDLSPEVMKEIRNRNLENSVAKFRRGFK